MQIKTFWKIFLKILGLLIIKDCISFLPIILSSIFSSTLEESIPIIISTISIIALYFLIGWIFILKSNWLIDNFHLNKDFEAEEINLKYDSIALLRISIIIIGGLMFVESFPVFCKSVFTFLQPKNIFLQNPEFGTLIFHLIKSIIGYLLIIKSKLIVDYIHKKTKKEEIL